MRLNPWLVSLVLCSAVPLAAQQTSTGAHPSQSPSVFRSSADLVTVDAVVTDRDGHHVTDLTRDDFEVTVSGKRQELQQAVYIRTADQPRALATMRPAPSTAGVGARSRASRALKQTGVQPDQVARTIALVVDDLGLDFRGIVDTRTMLHRFIETQMQPGDLVAIVRTGGGMGALQQFTADKRLLHMAANALGWNFRSRAGFLVLEPVGVDNANMTVDQSHAGNLRDEIASAGSLSALQYIARGISELPGRKCIVFVSAGFLGLFQDRFESGRVWNAMSRMLAEANASGAVIYTINAEGLATGGLTAEDNPQVVQTGIQGTYDAEGLVRSYAGNRMAALFDADDSLRFIAEQTGGIGIARTNDLNLAMRRVLDDQAGFYLLGYSAPNRADAVVWDQNRVKVRVKRQGLQVRARQGLFGPATASGPKTAGYDTLTYAAVSPFASTGITARLTSVFGHDSDKDGYIRSMLFVDANDLQFDETQPGRHTAAFDLILLALDDTGRLAGHWRRRANVVLDDEQFRLTKRRGLVYSMRMKVKDAGGYQIRAAVHDIHSDRTGAASQFLEVPKVGAGKLALSGVLLKGLDQPQVDTTPVSDSGQQAEGLVDAVLLEPEVRVFEPGTDVVYAYEIYDGLKPDRGSELQMGTTLLHDGRVVYQSPFSPVKAPPRGDRKMRAIPIAGKLALGADMPAGPYTLEVVVRSQNSTKLVGRQWLDFEVRDTAGSRKQ